LQKSPQNSPKVLRKAQHTIWTAEEDEGLLSRKKSGKSWKLISEDLNIPQTSCLRRYEKLTKAAVEWTDEMDERLAKAYQTSRESMWNGIALEIGLPWKIVEDRTWDLGKKRLVKAT
jgi:hypothetical protein